MTRRTTGLLFSVCFAALMAANDGKAQTASSNSNANSASGANSSSGSFSAAGGGNAALSATTSTQTGVSLDNRSYGTVPDRTTNNSFSQGDLTVRTTPTVYAPPVSGGNPCTLAVSGGVSVIGWGASAGGTFVDQDCANRQKIAMVHNAGYRAAGKELMCDDKATYIAFRTTGEPCSYRAQFEPAGSAAPPPLPVQLAPAVVVPAPPPRPVAAKDYPRCDARRGIVDNCRS